MPVTPTGAQIGELKEVGADRSDFNFRSIKYEIEGLIFVNLYQYSQIFQFIWSVWRVRCRSDVLDAYKPVNHAPSPFEVEPGVFCGSTAQG